MYFLITVDTEAHFDRSKINHLKRLIYGDFEDGNNIGIIRMMEIANIYNSKLNFFLDFSLVKVFGLDEFKKLVDIIKVNGHEIHVHIHIDQFKYSNNNLIDPEEIDKRIEFNKYNNCKLENNNLDDTLIDNLFGYIEKIIKICNIDKNNIGYRSGAWRYSKKIIHFLKKYNYKYSFNYNYNLKVESFKQIDNSINREPFVYPNGIIEIPVTVYNNTIVDLKNYNNDKFILFKKLIDYNKNINDSIITMIIHSWSLFPTKNEYGYFEKINNNNIDAFINIFDYLKLNNLRSCGITEITDMIYNKLHGNNNIYTLDYDEYNMLDIDAVNVIDDEKIICCYCNTPIIVDSDNSTPKRQCSGCSSLERGRAFKNLFDDYLKNILLNKDILCVSPSNADYNLLNSVNNVKTISIMPGCDIQIDMCNMDIIHDNTIDGFVAIKVFEHCENDLGAFNEIYRILKKDGLLIFTGDIVSKGETRIKQNIHSWYSKEIYDKYKVGTFRSYGVKSLYTILKDRFNIKIFNVKDNLTNTWHIFFVCKKI